MAIGDEKPTAEQIRALPRLDMALAQLELRGAELLIRIGFLGSPVMRTERFDRERRLWIRETMALGWRIGRTCVISTEARVLNCVT